MKKTVLTFGLISGFCISVLMGCSLLLANTIGSRHSLVLGYTVMVASFLLIYLVFCSGCTRFHNSPRAVRPTPGGPPPP